MRSMPSTPNFEYTYFLNSVEIDLYALSIFSKYYLVRFQCSRGCLSGWNVLDISRYLSLISWLLEF